jgi:hypothetical protein
VLVIEDEWPSDADVGTNGENTHGKTETRASCYGVRLDHLVHADGLDDEVASLSTIPGRHHILIGGIYANLDVDIAVAFGTQKDNGSSGVNARTANQQSLGIVHMRPKKLEGTVVADGWCGGLRSCRFGGNSRAKARLGIGENDAQADDDCEE